MTSRDGGHSKSAARALAALTAALWFGSPAACRRAPESEPPDTADTGWYWGKPDCYSPVVQNYPRYAAQEVYRRTPIRWKITPDWVGTPYPFSVRHSARQVSGRQYWDDDWLVFEPDEPLAPLTDYTVELDNLMNCPETSWFKTSELGLPTDPTLLVGHTYDLALDSADRWDNIGWDELPTDNLAGAVLPVDLLLEVRAANAERLTLVLAPVVRFPDDPPTQNLCFPTIVLEDVDFSQNPLFTSSPADWIVDATGDPSNFEGFTLTGNFSPDGTYGGGFELHGLLDTRPMALSLSNGGDPNSWCRWDASAFGARCVPCRDGEPYCFPVAMGWMEAIQRDEPRIVEVTDPCALYAEQCPKQCGAR